MTENSPEQPEQLPETDQPETDQPSQDGLHDAPEDIAEGDSTGYAVYDRTLGQYVPGVEKKKPSGSQATKRVPEGHTATVVRV